MIDLHLPPKPAIIIPRAERPRGRAKIELVVAGLFINPYVFAAAVADITNPSYNAGSNATVSSLGASFTGLSFGTTAADRNLLALIGTRRGATNGCTMSGVGIGGATTATQVSSGQQTHDNGTRCRADSWYRALTTGTTGDLTGSIDIASYVGAAFMRLTGVASMTPLDAKTATGTDPSVSLTGAAGAVACAIAVHEGGGLTTWTGLPNSQEVGQIDTGNNARVTVAWGPFTATATVKADQASTPGPSALVALSFV